MKNSPPEGQEKFIACPRHAAIASVLFDLDFSVDTLMPQDVFEERFDEIMNCEECKTALAAAYGMTVEEFIEQNNDPERKIKDLSAIIRAVHGEDLDPDVEQELRDEVTRKREAALRAVEMGDVVAGGPVWKMTHDE